MGDEARGWSFAQKFLHALKYAYEKGLFKGAALGKVEELLSVLTDPIAFGQFATMMTLGYAVKKGVCSATKAGSVLGPWASAALTAGEVAAFLLRIQAITTELESCTYVSEIDPNVGQQIADFTVDIVQDACFLAWVKKFTCFPAGTPVIVGFENGQWLTKPIEAIRIGDVVLARDEYGTRVDFHPVTDVSARKSATLVTLTLVDTDGRTSTLTATPTHPCWSTTQQEWIAAEELPVGDRLVDPHGRLQTVTANERRALSGHAANVYNFTVAHAHTYFVLPQGDHPTPVLVHNGAIGGCSGNAPSKVRYIDDTPKMGQAARNYEDAATGARSNVATQRRQVPVLDRTLPDGTKAPVKFDGIDGNVLIDRKTSITTFPKSKDQALRQSQALRENGFTGRWEVPNKSEANRALKMLQDLGITNIEVKVVP